MLPTIQYSNEQFWGKIKKAAGKNGGLMLEQAFVLFYGLKDPAVPAWAKATIVGALTYFIWIPDLIPDIIVGVGYTDDASVIAGALITVEVYISPATRLRAKKKVEEILGR